MLVDRAREINLVMALARGGVRVGLAGLLLVGLNSSLQNAVAEGDTRTLSFHHTHTGEDITITFKRNGRYDEAALKKLDWFMRDWRKEQETHMDPHLFDLLWEVYRDVGATEPIGIICGYRSPGTNAMLRARSTGVARTSQHISGKAIDFYIPGVSLAKIRAVGLRLQRGGVGFYPTSGSPFVHMDTASIRHWPSIPRDELVRIFPDERTVHIPADGRPLRNYALALADVERHGHAPNGRSLEAAREAGLITTGQEQQAVAVASGQPKRTLLAKLFGFGRSKDNDEETADTESAAAPAPRQARAPTQLASAMPKPKPVATARFVPMPAARPAMAVEVASAEPQAPAPSMVTAPVSARAVARNIWGDPIVAQPAAGTPAPFEVASAEPIATGSAESRAMSYAAESEPPPVSQARPMGRAVPQLPREATVIPAASNTTIALKPPPEMSIGGQRTDSPWLRAAMLTPSVSSFMTANRMGKLDPRWLADLIDKPAHALIMSFSADPHLGLATDHFSGQAVVFLATATFVPQTTASLR